MPDSSPPPAPSPTTTSDTMQEQDLGKTEKAGPSVPNQQQEPKLLGMPGRALDKRIAELMEPRASLPTITAQEARLREWGADPAKWSWTTSDYITSPLGWWVALIGTDHGPRQADHQPVRWQSSYDREPSTDIAAALLVVEALSRENTVILRWCFDGFVAEVFPHEDATAMVQVGVDPRDGGMPLAICRATLKAMEAQ